MANQGQGRGPRFLIKLSGESLGGRAGVGIDPDAFAFVGQELTLAMAGGSELAVVVGGGNFFRGNRSTEWDIDRVAADQVGMLATVMNGILLRDWLSSNQNAATALFSAIPVNSVVTAYRATEARAKLAQGCLVILAGGTGNPYFTTDTTACLRALELNCAGVIKATRVEGVFNTDPEQQADAVRYQHLDFDTAISRRLGVMDTAAFALCRDNQLPVRVLDITVPGNLARAVEGKAVGTLIS